MDTGVSYFLLSQALNFLYNRAAVIDKHSRRCNSLLTPSFLTNDEITKIIQ